MRLTRGIIGFACALACLAMCERAEATTIFYQFSGTGSGSFGGNTYSGAVFTVTGTADTANITSPTSPVFETFYQDSMSSATVAVSGIGSASLYLPMRAFAADAGLNVPSQIDFGDGYGTSPNYTTMLSLSGPSFDRFQLNSAFGPATGTIGFSPGTGFDCVGIGTFSLTSVSSLTFQSYFTPAPEPGSTAMLGAGLIAFAARMRRKRYSKAGQS